MGSRSWNLNRNIDSPLGKNSIFHNYYDDLPNSNYPEDALIDAEDKYTYQIIACNSGTEIFEKYNSTTEYQPTTRQIFIFVEKKDNKKSNLFGTACRVKMGDERKILMQKLLDGKTSISVQDDNQLAKNLKEWSEDIAYNNKGKVTEIEATVLLNAVKLELVNKSDFNEILQTIFGLNNKLSDWMNSGVEAMEKWKFTEENYEYSKLYVEPTYNKLHGFPNNKATFKPIIPVKIPNPIYANMANSKNIAATGIGSLLTLAEKFDEIAFGVVYNVVRATPNIEDDIFFAIVFYIKNYLEEYVLGSFKEIFKKIKELIAKAINFLKEVTSKTADFLSEQLAILNAFLCGLINGIVSLFQTVIVVLSFIVDNISIFELEKVSKTEISKHQEKLEFVEDLIDLISENAVELFSGLLTIVTTTKIWEEAVKFIAEVSKKVTSYSKYFWAYFVGAVVFELILDAIIAFFTGGASIAVEVSTKISRLASKATELASAGVKLGKQLGRKVAESASDLYKWLRRQIEEIIEAIKSGKLIEWMKKKFFELIGDDEGLRKLFLSKWISKFEKSFFNHIDGEWGITKIEKGFFKNEYIEYGQGGHNANAFGKNIRLKNGTVRIPEPPIDDLPFKAQIEIKYKNGEWLEKLQTSSMFPKNWKIERIQEEVAWVYEKAIKDNTLIKIEATASKLGRMEAECSSGFKIRIEFDMKKNILNAYPVIN